MSGLRSDPQFRAAAELLESVELDWAIIGGQVANEYRATPRQTEDFDFFVGSLDGLAEKLEAAGFEIYLRWPPGEEQTGLRQLRARRGGAGFDFNLIDFPAYHEDVIERAAANDGIAVVEDLLILKFLAWRDRDRDDVRSVLRVGRGFDRDLVREWTEAFGVDHRLDAEMKFAHFRREADARQEANSGHRLTVDALTELLYTDERHDWHKAVAVARDHPEAVNAKLAEQLGRFGLAARARQLADRAGVDLRGDDQSRGCGRGRTR